MTVAIRECNNHDHANLDTGHGNSDEDHVDDHSGPKMVIIVVCLNYFFSKRANIKIAR
jgi:hypothetical protein